MGHLPQRLVEARLGAQGPALPAGGGAELAGQAAIALLESLHRNSLIKYGPWVA